MKRIIQVKTLKQYKLQVEFSDGTKGVVDLSSMVGKGVFSLWNDYSEFEKVQVGPLGELVWNETIDLCPDSIYLKITHRQPEEVFPSLKSEAACA